MPVISVDYIATWRIFNFNYKSALTYYLNDNGYHQKCVQMYLKEKTKKNGLYRV